MSSNERYSALVDVDDDSDDGLGETELDFEDYHNPANDPKLAQQAEPSNTQSFGASSSQQRQSRAADARSSVLSLKYYSKYFDVETSDVLQRCWRALFPRSNFVEVVDDKPDLYGPFWIATTVVFVLFFSSTIAGAIASENAGVEYEYKFGLLSGAAALMFGYTFIVPIALWLILKYLKSDHAQLLFSITLYGYANTIWIPVAFVSIAPIEVFNLPKAANFLRWIAVAIGCAISTTFLVRNLYPVFSSVERQKFARLLLVGTVGLQVALALAVKLSFFAFTTKSAPSD